MAGRCYQKYCTGGIPWGEAAASEHSSEFCGTGGSHDSTTTLDAITTTPPAVRTTGVGASITGAAARTTVLSDASNNGPIAPAGCFLAAVVGAIGAIV